jgi:hypothetical protein
MRRVREICDKETHYSSVSSELNDGLDKMRSIRFGKISMRRVGQVARMGEKVNCRQSFRGETPEKYTACKT